MASDYAEASTALPFSYYISSKLAFLPHPSGHKVWTHSNAHLQPDYKGTALRAGRPVWLSCFSSCVCNQVSAQSFVWVTKNNVNYRSPSQILSSLMVTWQNKPNLSLHCCYNFFNISTINMKKRHYIRLLDIKLKEGAHQLRNGLTTPNPKINNNEHYQHFMLVLLEWLPSLEKTNKQKKIKIWSLIFFWPQGKILAVVRILSDSVVGFSFTIFYASATWGLTQNSTYKATFRLFIHK